MYNQLGYFLHFQFNFTEKLMIVEENSEGKNFFLFSQSMNYAMVSTKAHALSAEYAFPYL